MLAGDPVSKKTCPPGGSVMRIRTGLALEAPGALVQMTLPEASEFCIAAQPPPTYPRSSSWIFPLHTLFVGSGGSTLEHAVMELVGWPLLVVVRDGQLMTPRFGSFNAINV